MKKLSEKELEMRLRDASLRVTPHRLAVFRLIAGSKQALTVHTIFDSLRKKYSLDQATLYRNLSSLHEAGLVRRLDFNHGHAHYELETGKPSHQLVCGSCETIEKIEGISIDDLVKKFVKKSTKFKKTNSHTIEIYGLCKKCG